jgi:hypothetical protein
MAKRFRISKDSVARIWRDHELRPWKVEAFKISNDPHFEEKLVDVVGLYLNPPERAIDLDLAARVGHAKSPSATVAARSSSASRVRSANCFLQAAHRTRPAATAAAMVDRETFGFVARRWKHTVARSRPPQGGVLLAVDLRVEHPDEHRAVAREQKRRLNCACALPHHCGAIAGQSAGSVTTRIGTPARYAATSSAIRCHAVRKTCSVT